MNMTRKLVDIIIPVYKAHDTLFKTLASIAAQTMSDNITVYIINDACPMSDYISIINKFSGDLDIILWEISENSGPGYARQIGLEISDAPYVMFCDADDVFASPTAVEILYMNIARNNSNVVGSSFIEQTSPGVYMPHNEDMVWVFNKIYKRQFLLDWNIRFPTSRGNEDTCFNRKVIIAHEQLNKPIISINFISYLWSNQNKNSITRANNGFYIYDQNIIGFLEGMSDCVHWMEQQNIKREIVEEQLFGCTIFLWLFYCSMTTASKEAQYKAFDCMQKFYHEILSK